MSRRLLIAGNWKMNLTRQACVALAEQIATHVSDRQAADVVVCPPHVYLDAVVAKLANTPVAVGAQNVFWESEGAFTGETSPAMLVDIGCTYVIVGHSERRHLLGETNDQVNRKVQAALGAGLTPIVCLGERLQEREAGQTRDVIRQQCEGSFAGLSAQDMARIVIAYEPVWAIGTGQNATPQQAQEVHADLRTLIQSRYNTSVADALCIQYGGSVTPDNAADLLAQPDVDGALVGGASLVADRFVAIIEAAGRS